MLIPCPGTSGQARGLREVAKLLAGPPGGRCTSKEQISKSEVYTLIAAKPEELLCTCQNQGAVLDWLNMWARLYVRELDKKETDHPSLHPLL